MFVGLRPLEINSFSAGTFFIRQILTYKELDVPRTTDVPHTKRVKLIYVYDNGLNYH